MNKGDGGCDDGLFQDLQIEKTRSEIKVLLAFLDAKYTNNIEDEETRHKKSPPTATFEMLWMLLNPATRVYTDIDGEPAAFVIRSATTNKASNSSWYRVEPWYLDFYGDKFRSFRHKSVTEHGARPTYW